MPNPFFQFKEFIVYHDRCAMKVTTDACLFGAWTADMIQMEQSIRGKEQSYNKPLHILDIGAGTGLLSLMIAQKNAVAIDAVELDAAAAGQATENTNRSPWKDNITVVHQDVLQWKPGKIYDIIISNPPFYQNELKSAKAEKNIAHHDTGLQVPDLIQFIKNNLKEDGVFFLLLPAKRETELDSLLTLNGLYLQRKVLVQQTQKHPPFRVMIQGCYHNVDRAPDTSIVIKNSDGEYTSDFTFFLKDYYLYL